MRYWEIDFFRGIAIIMMILYHICFDVTFLGIFFLPIHSIQFLLFLYPIGTLFLLLVGVSLTIKKSKIDKRTGEISKQFLPFLKQGARILLYGLVITVATYLYPHQGFIVFGVLHCIGLSVILAYPFIQRPYISLVVGSMIILGGILISSVQISVPWLLWMGLRPFGFYTLDYFPLLPWFGVVLIGVYIGNMLYPRGERRFVIKKWDFPSVLNSISYLGQHSLVIYLFHQPIILGILTIIFRS